MPYESSGGSYIELAQVLRRISSNPAHDLHQLFRRMVFNLVIDNTDHHVKNHGVLYAGNGQYKLAPAFDVVMRLTNLAIKLGNHNSEIDLAIEAAPHFGINAEAGQNIIAMIANTAYENLLPTICNHGGDNALSKRVAKCFEHQQGIVLKN